MKKLLFTILFLFTVGTIYARDYSVSAIKTDNNQVDTYYGESISTVITRNNLEISLSIKPVEYSELRVCVDIKNLGDETFKFNERNIRSYQGNYDDNTWSETDYVPASVYYEKAEDEAHFKTVMAAIGLGIAAIDAGFAPLPPEPFIPGFSKPRGRRYEIVGDGDPAMVGFGLANLFITLNENESTLEYLDHHLLFSAEINPKEGYSGIFFLPAVKGPDYKIRMKIDKEEIIDFYFTRSDKEEILHPWADTDRTKFAFTVNPGFRFESGFGNSLGMNFLFLTKATGGYFGFDAGYGHSAKYDAVEFYSINGGVTEKIAPHTWLVGGLGFEYFETYTSIHGSLSHSRYQSSYGFAFGPELGMNFNFNWIDFGFNCKYKFAGTAEFSTAIGFAF